MTAKGPLDPRWPVIENLSDNVDVRTSHNYALSDGTLALTKPNVTDGTILTIQGPIDLGRPLFVVNMNDSVSLDIIEDFKGWMKDNKIACLNIGGPRHSYYEGKVEQGDIEKEAIAIISTLLKSVVEPQE
jgi:hypothetical protein